MLLKNLQDGHIGTGEEAHDTERDQGSVLPQSPVESTHSRSFPVRYDFNDRREDQSQCTQAHSPDQRDERAQIGDESCYQDCKYLEEGYTVRRQFT